MPERFRVVHHARRYISALIYLIYLLTVLKQIIFCLLGLVIGTPDLLVVVAGLTPSHDIT